jgi:hypothetical protein
MLVTFQTQAYPDITMFGEIAIKLLKLMGHSGAVPSAIDAADIGNALQNLRQGIAREEAVASEKPDSAAQNEDEEPHVGLTARAFPLIEMLEAAEEEQVPVMWREI